MGVVTTVVKLLAARKNVVLHGPGGTGKSHTIHSIVSGVTKAHPDLVALRAIGGTVSVVTPTGISAVNLTQSGTKARTVHSWSGIKGDSQKDAKTLAERISADRFARSAWQSAGLLIIDEISMVGKDLWEKLNYIGQYVRNSPRPFGGITILACGDFFQLPPVKDDFVFESVEWTSIEWGWVELTVPKRYENLKWFETQLRIRRGEPTKEDFKLIEDRIRAYDEFLAHLETNPNSLVVKPTVLYCTNVSTDSENVVALRKLTTKSHIYRAEVNHVSYPKKRIAEEYVKSLFFERIPEVIELKVGAQVMLKANIDLEASLANGSRGVVTEITEAGVHVLWATGADTWVVNYVWSHEDDNGMSTCSQIPLVLAWAMTIHKSQSLTLDSVVVDLQGVFSDGQAYVGISRCRTYEGLYIMGLKPGCFRASAKVLKYVDSVLATANKLPTYEADVDPTSRVITSEGLHITYYPRFASSEEVGALEGTEEDDLFEASEAIRYRLSRVCGYEPAGVSFDTLSREIRSLLVLKNGTLVCRHRDAKEGNQGDAKRFPVVAGALCHLRGDTLERFEVESEGALVFSL